MGASENFGRGKNRKLVLLKSSEGVKIENGYF